MRIGAVFPQTEIGDDPAAIRDYAQAVEEMGDGRQHQIVIRSERTSQLSSRSRKLMPSGAKVWPRVAPP